MGPNMEKFLSIQCLFLLFTCLVRVEGAVPTAVPGANGLPTTTVLPPILPCQCLGDLSLLANVSASSATAAICLAASKARLTADRSGYIAEKNRCGTRNPALPSLDPSSLCFCSKTQSVPPSNVHWVKMDLKDTEAVHRWEIYNYYIGRQSTVYNKLLDAQSKEYITLKYKTEMDFTNAFLNTSAARTSQFVRAAVMSFSKGSGCLICSSYTTSTTSTSTTAPTSTNGYGSKKKRQTAGNTTLPIVYDSYVVSVFMEFQFMTTVDAPSFKAMFDAALLGGVGRQNFTNQSYSLLPRSIQCPNVGQIPVTLNNLPSMYNTKPINLVNVTVKYPNGTNKMDQTGNLTYVMYNITEVQTLDAYNASVDEEILIKCRDPSSRPVPDIYDLDPYDGAMTAVCQPDGNYSLQYRMISKCMKTCNQSLIPVPAVSTGLILLGLRTRLQTGVLLINNLDPMAMLYAGDQLVYVCRQPNYGIAGGQDTILDRYICTNDTGFNTPIIGDPSWPVCQPQTFIVVQAVELVLAANDLKLENRNKLINYKESDDAPNIVYNSYLLNVTTPTLVCMLIVILLALLCGRRRSKLCSLCAPKD